MIGIRCMSPRMMLSHARRPRSRLGRESLEGGTSDGRKWDRRCAPRALQSARHSYVFGSNLSITASARRMYCVGCLCSFRSPLPIISFPTQHPQHLHTRPMIASTAATTTQRYRHCPPTPRSCHHARHQRALQTQSYLKPKWAHLPSQAEPLSSFSNCCCRHSQPQPRPQPRGQPT